MFQKIRHLVKLFKANPLRFLRPMAAYGFAIFVFVLAANPSFAQTAVPTLDLDPDVITSALFTGANIMLGSLTFVIILLAGFKFGGAILGAISDAVTSFRI